MCYGAGQRLRLTTDSLPGDPLQGWHGIFAGQHPDCTLEALSEEPFRAELDVGGVGALGFGYHRERAVRFRNGVDPSAPGGTADTILFVALDGVQRYEHGGRTGELAQHGAMFGFGALPATMESVMEASSITISLPPAALRGRFGDLERIAGLSLDPALPEMRLLTSYLGGLRTARDLDSSEVGALVTRQVTDLVIAALQRAVGEGVDEDVQGGVAAARLRVVEELIRRHHADPLLNADRIAQRLGMSPRYVQQLVAQKGLTVTEAIHAARLDAAVEKLTSPAWMGRPISEIAYSTGFTDPSHFVRVFRRWYGVPPSEMRV